ncbi:DUF4269 domain-containing protein [Nitrospirillum amazonense]|uniref:Uncharacterized protein DUF4269 n=1 Tax=Nitrospirillum amazonense TaxID=28077 RepID=A0A560K9Q9_9PROT|nr:DUF4269 domain-containing protein [Nitrospirillum amazonense]MDG3443830.1 DUF4269 domain-containing protein [Nitrospirillum amazonense]TWB77390.1 uncharacterized protein DUF4269 [Nitrospirillum amazonense]
MWHNRWTEKPSYEEALALTGLMKTLAAFNPRVAGTPPLGLDLPSSDIDILCHARDATALATALWTMGADWEDFTLHQWRRAPRPIIARFRAHGWAFEVFGSPEPVEMQAGWRHFMVEARLLSLGGPALRAAVMAARLDGLKTEPAFAQVLKLRGDPYAALLLLAAAPEDRLSALVAAAGFIPASRGLLTGGR